jgi:hypothetical protein
MFLHAWSPHRANKDIEMPETTYNVFAPERGLYVKAWTKGLALEGWARQEILNAAQLPFVLKWVAANGSRRWRTSCGNGGDHWQGEWRRSVDRCPATVTRTSAGSCRTR